MLSVELKNGVEMLAIAGAIILVICLIPILHIIVGLFWMILGLGVWLIVVALAIVAIALFANGTLPLEILIYGVGFFLVFQFIRFLGMKSTKNNYSDKGHANPKNAINKNSDYDFVPKSIKIETREAIRKLIPALTTDAKILKIKALNKLERQQFEYRKKSIKSANHDLDNLTLEIIKSFEEKFKMYIDSGLISLEVSECTELLEKISLGNYIFLFFDGNIKKVASINIKVRPLSKVRVERKVSLELLGSQNEFYLRISNKKLLRKINKVIIQELKKKPDLAERIKIS